MKKNMKKFDVMKALKVAGVSILAVAVAVASGITISASNENANLSDSWSTLVFSKVWLVGDSTNQSPHSPLPDNDEDLSLNGCSASTIRFAGISPSVVGQNLILIICDSPGFIVCCPPPWVIINGGVLSK